MAGSGTTWEPRELQRMRARWPMRHRLPRALLLLASLALVAACAGSSGPSSAPSGSPVAPVVRTVLAGGLPAAAAGYNLELVRYVIQPATKLVAHHHPGMQLALIESGTLTYTVIEGTVTVHQADGGSRTIAAGETGKITAGEWIAEDETVVHFGANDGAEPVVILASSLLEADEKPAIPVPTASP